MLHSSSLQLFPLVVLTDDMRYLLYERMVVSLHEFMFIYTFVDNSDVVYPRIILLCSLVIAFILALQMLVSMLSCEVGLEFDCVEIIAQGKGT